MSVIQSLALLDDVARQHSTVLDARIEIGRNSTLRVFLRPHVQLAIGVARDDRNTMEGSLSRYLRSSGCTGPRL